MKMKPKVGIRAGGNTKIKVKTISRHKPLAETQLNISELKFRRLFETAQDGILLLDADSGAITDINPFLLKSLGYSHAEIIGKKIWEIGLFKDVFASKIAFKELQKKKYIRYKDLPLKTKSGVTRYVEFVSNIYKVGEKKVIQCNIRDITNQKIIAEVLRTNEGRYRELFNRMSNCVAVYEAVENGKDFIFKDFNAAAERVEKTPRQKILGRKVTEVFPGILEMGLLETFRQVWKSGKAQSYPISIYKDNHIFGWRENFVYKLPSGEIVAIYDDATERKKAEIDLQESEAHYRGLFENSPISLWEEDYSAVKKRLVVLKKRGVTDFHAYLISHPKEVKYCLSLIKVLDVNQATLRLFNAKQKGDLLKPLTAVVSPQTLIEFQEELSLIAEGKTFFNWETKNQKLTGETIDVNLSWSAAPGHESDLSKVHISMIDITERRRSEKALQESEFRFRSIFEDSPIALWEEDFSLVKKRLEVLKERGILDINSYLESHPKEVTHCTSLIRVLSVNKATIKLYQGKSKADMMKMRPGILSPSTLQSFRKEFVEIAEGKVNFNFESTIITRKGHPRFVNIFGSVAPGHETDLSRLFISIIDITERHEVENALQESESRFRSLFENSPICLWEEDFSDVKIYLDNLKKRGITDIRSYFESHPKETVRCASLIKRLDWNNAALELIESNNKFDSIYPLATDNSPQAMKVYRDELALIAEGKDKFVFESKIRTETGRIKDVSLFWSVIPGHENDLSKVLISIIDITERRQTEIALRKSEIRYRSLFEDSPIALWEEDYSEVKKYLDGLKKKGIQDFREYFKKHPQEVKKCLGLIKILNINNSVLKLYNASNKSEVLNGLAPIFSETALIEYAEQLAQIAEGKRVIEQETEAVKLSGEKMAHNIRLQAAPGSEDSFARVIVSVMDITDRKRAEQSLQNELKERIRAEERQRLLAEKEHSQRIFSEALTKNALSLNSILDTEKLLNSIISNIQEVIPFEAVSIIMIEAKHGKIVRFQGFDEKESSTLIKKTEFDFSKFATFQKVIESGAFVLITDTRKDPTWIRVDATATKTLSCIQMPILENNKVIGILTLNSSIPNFYKEEHAHRLMAFTEQVSNAMKNARLFENTQRRMNRMNAMTLIDQAINSSLDINVSLEVVLMQALEQLGVDASDILLVNQVSNSLTFAKARGFRTSEITKSKLSLGAGLSGQAIMERRIVSIPDLRSAPESFFRNLLIEKEGFISYYCVPLITKGLIKGVMEVYFRKPFVADSEWLEFFEMLAQQSAIAINNAELLNSLQISNNDLKNAYDSTLQGWVEALDLRDKENEGHSTRVTDTTLRLAIHFNFEDKEMIGIKRGALLHDIGKISISDTIINKPGPLSEEEWKIMRKHPEYAFQLLSKTKYLRDALDIPYCHHEKWDGSGYPRGLKGETIPLAARIFAVVDVWDALTSDRPYRSAWSYEKALDYIKEQSGKHFDPQVVNVFVDYLKSIHFKTE